MLRKLYAKLKARYDQNCRMRRRIGKCERNPKGYCASCHARYYAF